MHILYTNASKFVYFAGFASLSQTFFWFQLGTMPKMEQTARTICFGIGSLFPIAFYFYLTRRIHAVYTSQGQTFALTGFNKTFPFRNSIIPNKKIVEIGGKYYVLE